MPHVLLESFLQLTVQVIVNLQLGATMSYMSVLSIATSLLSTVTPIVNLQAVAACCYFQQDTWVKVGDWIEL